MEESAVRKIVTCFLTTLLVCGSAIAGDYIRIGVDSIPVNADSFEIPFYVERTCGSPEMVMRVENGFEITSTSDASWSLVGFAANPVTDDWFILGGLYFSDAIDGTSPDSFYVSGSNMWPYYGMPYTTDVWLFSLYVDVGPGRGEILIDSAFIRDYGFWRWYQLACGEGGALDRPLFVDKYGSDATHPIVITVYDSTYVPYVCGDANRSGAVDIDDVVHVINFVFAFGPEPDPLIIGDCDCSGGDVPVDIDDIVYLLDYILRGGPAPCDTDGDGEPDC